MINCVSLTEDCVKIRTISENSVLKIPKLLLQIMCKGSLFRSILSAVLHLIVANETMAPNIRYHSAGTKVDRVYRL